MKFKLSILLFLGVMTQAFSQDGLSRHLKGIEGCYLDYYSEFANKGAKTVSDGEHEVIISIIYQANSECSMGKVTVKGGKIMKPVLIQKDDMAYVPLSALFNNLDMEWFMKQDNATLFDINDGMSKLFVSQEGYRVQLFFPEFINTNSGVNRKAPPASEVLKKDN